MTYAEYQAGLFKNIDGHLGTSTLSREEYDAIYDGFAYPDDGSPDKDLDDWYCVEIKPWQCQGCGRTIEYVTFSNPDYDHAILVWPTQDDPNLLKNVRLRADAGEEPSVLPFEQSFGKPVSYYEYRRLTDEHDAA